MKKYILYNIASKIDPNAGSKAAKDVVVISEKRGYEPIPLYVSNGVHTTINNLLDGLLNTYRLCCRLNPGDVVFLQYPINRYLLKQMYRMLNRKKAHIITLIHDIDYLRDVSTGNKDLNRMKAFELSLLRQSEYLICHNQAMIKELHKAGLSNKMIPLELFDYLYEGPGANVEKGEAIIVAGNLSEQKAGYIYKLKDQRFPLALYGGNLNKNFQNQNTGYRGSFAPDELIKNLYGSFGLVWDGPECDTCGGSYGKYLMINNPHKVSLYLAAGLPVIVWKQSALYPFVAENGLGFGVESLNEIYKEITEHDYETLRKNVETIKNRVRRGYYLDSALDRIEKEVFNV